MARKVQRIVALALAMGPCLAAACAESPGAGLYRTNCQVCHGASGSPTAGAKGMGAKAASDPEVKRMTAQQEFDLVKNGRAGMKPFASKLTDAQIRDVVAYFRTLK